MDFLTGISDSLYLALNGLAGRSWLFDTLAALPMDNNLVKAAPIGACFMFAWFSGEDAAASRNRRASLIVTMLSLLFVMAATKAVSSQVFLPRPFILSQQTYHLDGDRLVESARLEHRAPLNGDNRERAADLARGDVVQNDLGSFPSDHAGFYVALALGIALACRRAGIAALAWTVIVILISRIVTGMHSPLDIAAGSLIGASVLLLFHSVFRRWGRRLTEPVAGWTIRHPALSSALLFLIVFEMANTLENARHIGGTAKDALERMAG